MVASVPAASAREVDDVAARRILYSGEGQFALAKGRLDMRNRIFHFTGSGDPLAIGISPAERLGETPAHLVRGLIGGINR